MAEEEEAAVAPLASRAVDFLILALAEGPLDRDTLIETAQTLGCKNKNLEVYLRQRKREEDGYITLYLDRFELTRKGRDQMAALGGPVVVVEGVIDGPSSRRGGDGRRAGTVEVDRSGDGGESRVGGR